MIAYVKGTIAYKSPTYVVIDVGGLGYQVNISLHTYEKISELDHCLLLTHQVIREDAHQLYGFVDENERELFRQLIGISGVGPNTARMMLSALPPEEIKRAIIAGDVSLIRTIKGIGPKSAQRIIVELQDILKKSHTGEIELVTEKTRSVEEAVSALITLGFQRNQAEKAVSTVIRSSNENLNVEEILKQALKLI